MTETVENLTRRVFYHGTSLEAARGIHESGFKVWFNDEEFGRYSIGGNLGTGIYVTCNWRTALWFGDVLLRVEMEPGTRILDASRPPDSAVLRYLQREFGRGILKDSPWKAIPHNKRLKLSELIALVRYHYQATWTRENWNRPRPLSKHFRLLGQFKSMLVRYGFHGYGNPADDNGIVIFAEDRLQLVELIAELPRNSLTSQQQEDCPDCFETLDEVSRLYVAKGSAVAKDLGAGILRKRNLKSETS